MAAPAIAASMAESAIWRAVIGTSGERAVVSPAPVTAQVMKDVAVGRERHEILWGRGSKGNRGWQASGGRPPTLSIWRPAMAFFQPAGFWPEVTAGSTALDDRPPMLKPRCQHVAAMEPVPCRSRSTRCVLCRPRPAIKEIPMSAIEMPSTSAFVPRKATRKDWLGLAVIALPCMLYSMDLTVLNLAVPQIDISLRPSPAQMLWIVDIYGFMVAGALITMGTLGDRIGRRRLLMIGAVAFGAASVLAAFSTSATMLIVARALLGLAAATLAPSTLSLISNMFHDSRERTFRDQRVDRQFFPPARPSGRWSAACFSTGSGGARCS